MSAPSSTASSGNEPPKSAPRFGRVRSSPWVREAVRAGVFLWKFTVGLVLCQSWIGSLLVIGWVYRFIQRTALKRWWARSRLSTERVRFAVFADADPETRAHRHWPNWIVGQNHETMAALLQPASLGALKRFGKGLIASIWQNLRLGFQGTLNIWLLTLPGCSLMLFSWYDGWNNSFHKGYEQAAVGPLLGLAGIGLWVAAMLYLPMAQARQAVTGRWQSFYQFGLIWRLIQVRWLACLGLAALYSLFSVPVLILKVMPYFFTQINPEWESLSATRVAAILNTYFFWAAALIFPAYLALRWVGARIYASGMLHAVRSGRIELNQLSRLEENAFQRLDLGSLTAQPERSRVGRATRRSFAVMIFGGGLALTGVVWFTVIAQVYIGQFLNYWPGVGWLNHPLVQLPWFHFVP